MRTSTATSSVRRLPSRRVTSTHSSSVVPSAIAKRTVSVAWTASTLPPMVRGSRRTSRPSCVDADRGVEPVHPGPCRGEHRVVGDGEPVVVIGADRRPEHRREHADRDEDRCARGAPQGAAARSSSLVVQDGHDGVPVGRRKAEHHLGHADLGEVVELLGAGERPERDDVQVVDRAAGVGPLLLQRGDRRGESGAADGDPPVGVLDDVGEQLGSGAPAQQDRRSTRPVGLGELPAGLERDELTVEPGHVVGPERPHGQHRLADHRPAMSVVDAVVGHLLAVPAEADPEDEAPCREPVQRGRRLRRGDGVALGDQRDPGAQRDRLGHLGGSRQHDERVERAAVLVGELGVARGRGRATADRDVRVLGQVERVESPRLGLDGELDRVHRPVGGEHRDPVAHRAILGSGPTTRADVDGTRSRRGCTRPRQRRLARLLSCR